MISMFSGGSGLRLGSPTPGMLRLLTAFKATELTHAHFRVFKGVSTVRSVNQGLNHNLSEKITFYQVCLKSDTVMMIATMTTQKMPFQSSPSLAIFLESQSKATVG